MKHETTVQIYVRHSQSCQQKNSPFARGCDCPKAFRWSLNGKQYREAAGTRSWERAEELRKEKEAALRSGENTPKSAGEERKTLTWAYKLFLQEKKQEGVCDDVYNTYDRQLSRFVKFCEDRNKFFPKDIDKELILAYKATWEEAYPSTSTRHLAQARFKSFLNFMREEGCILGRFPKLKKIKVVTKPKLPLTDEQYQTLLSKVGVVLPADEARKIHALIQFMRHTGLSITDAVKIRQDRITEDTKGIVRVQTYRQKTGEYVCVPMPADVAAEVVAIAKESFQQSNSEYVFWDGGVSHPGSSISSGPWGQAMRKVFRAAFGEDTQLTPHCLRDTFAVNLLTKRVPIEWVSKALGHGSISTTQDAYLPWVKQMQDVLDAHIVATFGA